MNLHNMPNIQQIPCSSCSLTNQKAQIADLMRKNYELLLQCQRRGLSQDWGVIDYFVERLRLPKNLQAFIRSRLQLLELAGQSCHFYEVVCKFDNDKYKRLVREGILQIVKGREVVTPYGLIVHEITQKLLKDPRKCFESIKNNRVVDEETKLEDVSWLVTQVQTFLIEMQVNWQNTIKQLRAAVGPNDMSFRQRLEVFMLNEKKMWEIADFMKFCQRIQTEYRLKTRAYIAEVKRRYDMEAYRYQSPVERRNQPTQLSRNQQKPLDRPQSYPIANIHLTQMEVEQVLSPHQQRQIQMEQRTSQPDPQAKKFTDYAQPRQCSNEFRQKLKHIRESNLSVQPAQSPVAVSNNAARSPQIHFGSTPTQQISTSPQHPANQTRPDTLSSSASMMYSVHTFDSQQSLHSSLSDMQQSPSRLDNSGHAMPKLQSDPYREPNVFRPTQPSMEHLHPYPNQSPFQPTSMPLNNRPHHS